MTLNHLKIDLNAIKSNYYALKELVPAKTQIMPVVKSDAYGHGAIEVTRSLEETGCNLFAVFEIDEAIILRKAGVEASILILMGVNCDEVEDVVVYNLIPAVYRFDIAEKISQTAQKYNKTISIHIKVDTGMTRLGIRANDLDDFIKKISMLKNINIAGIFSHLSISDEPANEFNNYQIKTFLNAISKYKNKNFIFHMANSGGIIGHIGSDFNVSRAGISLYGAYPNPDSKNNIKLKQAMHFCSKIIFIKTCSANSPVSYRMTYKTTKTTKIATIPVGYDDGYNRRLSNNGQVLIKGIRAPIIGRVCMNLSMIDVSHIPDVEIGDEVVLMGKQGNDIITVDEIASKIGTINYEVFCLFGKCNRKIYSDLIQNKDIGNYS